MESTGLEARIAVMEDLMASAVVNFTATALGSEKVRDWAGTLRRLNTARTIGSSFQVEYRIALENFLTKVEERLK